MSKILKFGGTSVGSAENIKRVADIVAGEKAVITVLSAMSGSTDVLVKISALGEKGETDEGKEMVCRLREKYTACIRELLAGDHVNEALGKAQAAFGRIEAELTDFKPYISEKIIISQGELLTTAIFTIYMNSTGRRAVLLHAPDMVRTDSENKVDTITLKQKLAGSVVDKDTYYITQGFICSNHRGETDNLGRGGSDYSAALMGAAIDASEVQIWTDIDGMHNNDPRFVDRTFPIRRMSFDEAAELAYFGAKILHPATITPCKEHGIPVKLKNTMDPQAEGTTISDVQDSSERFHAIAAKDGITVIRIYSTRMLMAYGFLRKVFEIFEQHRTPIDMITTSEVSVSLTIDSDCHLDRIKRELETLGTIEIERGGNTIVCVVGNLDHNNTGMAADITASVRHVPLKMISYGASHRSLAMLIDTKYKKEFLQSLNDTLFPHHV